MPYHYYYICTVGQIATLQRWAGCIISLSSLVINMLHITLMNIQFLHRVFPQIALAIGVLTSNRRGATNHFGRLDVAFRAPLLGAMVRCHCRVPLLGAIVGCHGRVPAIAVVPWLGSDFGRFAVPW